jgi:cysteine-rich repeat protein
MSRGVLQVLVVLACAPGLGFARAPLPPYDFTGTWTGTIVAGLDVNFVQAELTSVNAKKFTGTADIEGFTCTVRGKRKQKVKVKFKCEARAKAKFKGFLDIAGDAIFGEGRVKQGRHKAPAQLLLERFVFVEPICGNGAVETGEQCDDGATMDGDGCSASCAVEIAAELDEIEPNGEAAQATPVPTLPALVHGSLMSLFDEDFFRVEITGTQLILETFDGNGPGTCAPFTDTIIELRGPDGLQVVAIDDDDGIGACSRLVVTGLTPGVYYPCVRTAFTGIDAYQLHVVAP